MEEIILEEITCSKCGGHKFVKGAAEKGIYTCLSEVDGKACNHTMLRCEKCDKIMEEDQFGRHSDVYECKKCGTIHWPYTEMIRNREEVMRIYSQASSRFKDILSSLR